MTIAKKKSEIPQGDADDLISVYDLGEMAERRYMVHFTGSPYLSFEMNGNGGERFDEAVHDDIPADPDAVRILFADLPLPCRILVLQALEERDFGNDNCLCGLWCPNCGSKGPFSIVGEATFTVYNSGTDDHEGAEWQDFSPITCNNCDHDGLVRDFDPFYEEKAVPSLSDLVAKLDQYAKENPGCKVVLTDLMAKLHEGAVSLEGILEGLTT